MSTPLAASVDGVVAQERSRLIIVLVLCASTAIIAGALGASLSVAGHLAAVLVAAGLVLPVVLWRWPTTAVVLAILAAALIEQFPIDPFPLKSVPAPAFTDQIPLFQSLNDGMGLSGVLLNPLELVILLAAVIWLMRAVVKRHLQLPTSALAVGFAVLLGLALLGEGRGLAHGGDLRESLRELRPWVYLGSFFLLASQLLTQPGALRALQWAFVTGTGIKGLQGTYRFLAVRGSLPRPEAILAHEEAVFFGLFLLLTATLWMFGEPSRLRWVATALAPAVLIANLGNTRRASWLILLAGLAALFLIAWIRLPHRRRVVAGGLALMTVLGLVYLPAFWNGSGGFAQPARAVRALVAPDTRDLLSDLYRQQEDANLQLNIERSMPLGTGFGIPIDYALPILDLTGKAPSLRFVPHNTILYVWMRLGLPGILAFWWLIGAAFLAACRLVRRADDRLAIFGTFVICALIAYLVEGYYDLGLSWFRVAVFMGCTLGALEAVRRMSPVPAAHVPARLVA